MEADCTRIEAFFEEHQKSFTHPQVLAETLKVLRDPSCSADKLSHFLENDPGISSRILKLANSAFFGTPRSITSLKAAIVRLGNRNISRLVLALAMTNTNRASKSVWLRFWSHSVSAAVLSRHMADFVNRYTRQELDEFFSMGLLHDVGLILVIASGKLTDVEARMRLGGLSMRRAEHEVLGFNHCDLGSLMAEKWGFPGDLKASIAFHHEPHLAQDFRQRVTLVHLADLICHGYRITCSNLEGAPETRESYLEDVRLPLEQLTLFGDWLLEQQPQIEAFGRSLVAD